MTPDVQARIQQLGYDPERAQEALPTFIRVAQVVMRFGEKTSPAEQAEAKKWADAALAQARIF